MSIQTSVTQFLLGSDPRLARMLGYWAGTCVLYSLCMLLLLLQVRNGTAEAEGARILIWFGVIGVLFFFGLVRVSIGMGIAPAQLAVLQALFAIACDVGAYMVTGPVRGAALMLLLVTIVFCTFSLRPRHTLLLCATALATIGAAMAWMVANDPVRFPLNVEAMNFALAACSLVSVTVLTGEMSKLRARLKRQKEALESALGTIRKLATIDELTSLANRRHMNEVLHAEERRQNPVGKPICIALLDLDFFKSVNDLYGHDGGDTVLRTFADAARAELRNGDILARWGGEEFLLLLPDTDLAQAELVLERIAGRVEATGVPALDYKLRITFSAGVVQRREQEPFAETITRADKAMYLAKTTGRDRIVLA
jgi:diguanylate cyclase (GGDEF)-like protein